MTDRSAQRNGLSTIHNRDLISLGSEGRSVTLAPMATRVITVVVACLLSLSFAASASARPQTTNAPAIVTIRVTVTDNAIIMKPKSAVRGSTAIFLFSNHTTKPHTLVIGDTGRGVGKTIGFATKLVPNGQQRVVMFLDYRGSLPYFSRNSPKSSFKGVFRIT